MNGTDHRGDGRRRTLRRLLVARLVAAIVLLGSVTVERWRAPELPGADPLFALLAVTFALTVLHALTLRLAERHAVAIDVQMVADAGVVSAAVLITGGFHSPLVPLYLLPVVAAAVVQFRRGGLMVAGVSTLLFAVVTLVPFQAAAAGRLGNGLDLALLPASSLAGPLFGVALNGIGFACVAWLTGYLAERLHRADERLQHADERLRFATTVIADLKAFNQCVIDSLTGGLATTDPAGRILTFNRAAEQITAWEAEAARGRPVQEVLQLPADVVRALPQLIESGRGRRMELEYTAPSGRRVDLGLTAAPLMGSAGRGGYLFTFQDVTELRRREREAQTEKRLAAIGEMAAGIAHEIRNPLASMAGSIQVLREDLHLSAEQSELMDIVLHESERLNDIVRNFLSYARPQRPAADRVDLRRVLRESAALLAHSAECQPTHAVEVRVAADLAAVTGDESHLRQVIWNLATNALKAMPDGGRLELRADAPDAGHVVLSVSDTGVGMSAAECERVFEPFRSSFSGGTGLGLAIVHRIVTDMRGTIEFDSAPGAGTTVRVRLPVREEIEPVLEAMSA